MARFVSYTGKAHITGPHKKGPPPLTQFSQYYKTEINTDKRKINVPDDPDACLWCLFPFWRIYIHGDTYGDYFSMLECLQDLPQIKRRYIDPPMPREQLKAPRLKLNKPRLILRLKLNR